MKHSSKKNIVLVSFDLSLERGPNPIDSVINTRSTKDLAQSSDCGTLSVVSWDKVIFEH
jgi:hypothetical protein